MFIHVRGIVSLYSTVDMMDKLCHGFSFSNTGIERNVLMEHCFRNEREDMNPFSGPFSLYVYFYLPIIYDLGVLIPFSSFETEFLTTVNVAPPQVIPNV